jgi:hypothetical protein
MLARIIIISMLAETLNADEFSKKIETEILENSERLKNFEDSKQFENDEDFQEAYNKTIEILKINELTLKTTINLTDKAKQSIKKIQNILNDDKEYELYNSILKLIKTFMACAKEIMIMNEINSYNIQFRCNLTSDQEFNNDNLQWIFENNYLIKTGCRCLNIYTYFCLRELIGLENIISWKPNAEIYEVVSQEIRYLIIIIHDIESYIGEISSQCNKIRNIMSEEQDD